MVFGEKRIEMCYDALKKDCLFSLIFLQELSVVETWCLVTLLWFWTYGCARGVFVLSDRNVLWTVTRFIVSILNWRRQIFLTSDISGLVQESCNSSALAVELCLSCTNPSICHVLCHDAKLFYKKLLLNHIKPIFLAQAFELWIFYCVSCPVRHQQ